MIEVYSDKYDEDIISLAQDLVDKFLPSLNFVTKLNLRYFDKNTIDLYAYLPQLAQPYYKVLTSLPCINMEKLTDCVIVNIRFYYKNDKWNLNTQEHQKYLCMIKNNVLILSSKELKNLGINLNKNKE